MDLVRLSTLLLPFLGSSPETLSPSPEETASGAKALSTRYGDESSLLAAPAVLLSGHLDSISIYIDVLLRWSSRMNLTSVRQPEDIVTRHFGESFFLARHLFPAPVHSVPGAAAPARIRVIDVGSGAGFPGLPIKLWAPQIHLTLIESSLKKATFLRELVRALTLTDVDVFAGRAAAFPKATSLPADLPGDVVTLRAVERFDSILPEAITLAKPGGRVALMVGQSQLDRIYELSPAVVWGAPLKLPLSSGRVIIIGVRNQGS